MENNPLIIKDPMRDSLLSSEYDPYSEQLSRASSPDNKVTGCLDNNTTNCSNNNRNRSNINDWLPYQPTEESWEGIGIGENIYISDDKGNESPNSIEAQNSTTNSNSSGGDASVQELEFDYWQGQFEFCLPGLQDCPFIPNALLERLESGEGSDSLCSSIVYRDLLKTVKILQGKVDELGDSQNDSQDRIVRVKQDNSVLQARVNMLEEQLRESEHRADERLSEEQRRNRDLIMRIEREKTLTVENYSIKQISLEKTNEMLSEEVMRLKGKTERHFKEKNELENRIMEFEMNVNSLQEEKKSLESLTKREIQEDKERSAREILELRSELERLGTELETHRRRRLPSVESEHVASTTDHLNASIRTMRQENTGLREQVDDLQAQLLTKGLEEGERVTAAHTNSLKAEFEQMSVEELQKSLREAQDDNKHLRAYIDGILLNIIEKYPQLLEVKQKL